MTRKTRIIISLLFVVIAFAAGIGAYAAVNVDRSAQADAEEVYFVDASGKIALPPHDNSQPVGSEKNPLFVLEIVPYEGMAEFGYHIAGCEPINLEKVKWDGEETALPGKGNLFKETTTTEVFWENEAPEGFLKYKVEGKYTSTNLTQYGTMKYVTDGTGNYNLSSVEEAFYEELEYNLAQKYEGQRYKRDGSNYVKDEYGCFIKRRKASFVPAENGNYKWEPLTVERCKTLSTDGNEDRLPYVADAYVDNADFNTYLSGTKYIEIYNVEQIEHYNFFLKESIGLAYEMQDGERKSLTDIYGPEEGPKKLDEKIKNYHSVVYTVTPEDLNLNPELIDHADLIYFSSASKFGSGTVYQIFDKFKRDDLFKHKDSKVLNVVGATFATNPIDWDIVLKIYGRATADANRCPIIYDTSVYTSVESDNQKAITLNQVFANGETSTKGGNGTQNNMYKLFLMLYQMEKSTFVSMFGDPTDTGNSNFSKTQLVNGSGNVVKKKDGTDMYTGVFLGDNASGSTASTYWNRFTFIPWRVMPDKATGNNSTAYKPILDALGIMEDSNGVFHFTSGDAQNMVRFGVHIYNSSNYMTSHFTNDCGVKNNPYGREVYDYFESIGVHKTEVSTAEILYFLMNNEDYSHSLENNNSYRVLELQPATKFKSATVPGTATNDVFWKAFISKYTNTTGTVTVDRMSTSEFIGKHVEIISEYDLIYVGVNTLANNWTMDFSGTDYIYAHTGPTVTISGKSALHGWLADSSIDVSKYALSGNDLTKQALDKLQKYVDSGAPLLFGTGFFTDENATAVASNIDHNSYMYQLYAGSGETSGISNPIYEFALSKETTYMATDEALRKGLAKSRRVELEVTSKPKEYSGVTEHSDHSKSENYLSNNTLSFNFKVNAPAGTSYELVLYVDANGDGTFTINERLDNIKIYNNGNKVTNRILEAGKTYSVSREVTDRVGAVAWKLDLVANTPSVEVENRMVYASLQGLSAIKATTTDTLNILQIVKDSGNVLLLPQDTDNYGSLTEYQKKFWDWTRNINGLDLHFTRMTQAEVLDKLDENEKYLNSYNMLILGFGDCYNGARDEALLDAIEAFVATGKAVLYTHDASSTVGADGASADDKSWATDITWRFRDRFGMDRYDVSIYRGFTGKTRADYPYLASSTVSTDMVTSSTTSNKVEHKFSGLTPGGYGYTATPSGDAVNVSFDSQYQEIQYTLPTAVNMNDCEKIIIKYATASNDTAKAIAIKLKDEADSQIHVRYNLVSTAVTEYEVNASDLVGKKVSKVCFMANNEACSATVYSVTFVMKAFGSPTTSLLTQGFTNGHLYRHAQTLPHNLFAKRVSKVNSGAITQYPYEIPDSFEIAKTHTQYYQLDMEQKELNVWYCLADGTEVNGISEVSGKADYQNKIHNYFNATANDGRNNYYIYNYGNITYSGMGHDGNMTDTEIKLFINTFVAAYRATATPVKVVAMNADATKNAASGEYYLCVDVDSKNGDKLLGGTAQGVHESYELQAPDGTGFKVSGTETGVSKRVYFYLDDKTSGGSKGEYSLECSIDSFDVDLKVKPLAIYRTDDMGTDLNTTFMSMMDETTKFKSSPDEIYYVDVPIKMETVGTKKAVTTTKLNIKVTAKYTIGSEEVTTVGDTKIIITPRGLFDLD